MIVLDVAAGIILAFVVLMVLVAASTPRPKLPTAEQWRRHMEEQRAMTDMWRERNQAAQDKTRKAGTPVRKAAAPYRSPAGYNHGIKMDDTP